MISDNVKCKICDSYNTYQMYEDLNVIKCSDCQNSFINHYSNEIIYNYKTRIPMPNYFDNKLRNRHHYNFISSNIDLDKVKDILEIGSGSGSFIRYFRKKIKNAEITIIEPGSEYIPELTKIRNTVVYNDYVENINLSKNYDLIILSHVLEHVENPVNLIKYLHQNLLREGGHLYIDVPSIDYELRNINAAKLAPTMHLFFFDGIGIKSLLETIGFNNNKITGNKYKSLPSIFIKTMDQLGSLSGRNNLLFVVYLKIKIKFSLYLSSFYKTVFFRKPLIKRIEEKDFHFNNIAIIAQK